MPEQQKPINIEALKSLVRTVPDEDWLRRRNRTLVNLSLSYGTLKQPDTPDNAVTYFEVASLIVCPCTSNSNRTDLGELSWPEIKKGYATLEQNYGISNRKRNRFAYMATLAKDKSAAQVAFAQIGANRDTSVWASNEFFERVKSWANSQ